MKRKSGYDLLIRSEKYVDHVLALYMALFALEGYRDGARQAGVPLIPYILQATLVMFSLVLGGCFIVFLFGNAHSPARLWHQWLRMAGHIPELIALDGYALAAIRNKQLFVCGLIGIAVDFLLMLACKIVEWMEKRRSPKIIKTGLT